VSLPRLNSEDWDKLTWQICELLYVKAVQDGLDEVESSGFATQDFKPHLHKRDVDRFKKRLHELVMLELLQAKEDNHGQKRYIFDLYQLNRYQDREDVLPVFERLNDLHGDASEDGDPYSWDK
jgi:hypothetical protein